MPVLRKRRRSSIQRRNVPGRLRTVRYSRGQNIPTYTRSSPLKLVHIYPTGQSTPQVLYANALTPMVDSGTSGTPNLTVLNQIPRTAGTATRSGPKIRMRSLLLSLEAFAGTAATSPGHFHMKLFVYYDKRPVVGSAVFPAITDLYENNDFCGFRSLNSRDRFDVLYERDIKLDKVPVFNSVTQVTQWDYGSASRKVLNIRIPVDRITAWDDANSSGGYPGMTYGMLCLCVVSTLAGASSNPVINFNYKLSFDDLNM